MTGVAGTETSRELARRVARGAASTLGATVVSRGLAMLQSIAVARLLDPYRLGLFSIVSYVMSLAGSLCDLGMPVAVTRVIAEERAARPHVVLEATGRLLRVVVCASLAVAATLFLGADRLAALYREPSIAVLFRLGALALVVSVVGAYRSAVLQGLQQIHLLAGLSSLGSAAMLAFTLALVPWLGLSGIILATILTEGVAWLASGRTLARAIDAIRAEARGRRREAPPERLFARAFHVAAPSFLNALALFGSAWFVRSWLARAQGYEAVGLYQIADSVSRVLMLVSGAIAVPLMPAVAELGPDGHGRLGAGMETILRCTLAVTLPVSVFLALGGRSLLSLVFGRSYAGAATIMVWLALATVFQALANVLWSAQVGSGRIWVGFAITAAGQAVLVAAAVVLTPGWGLAGLGIAVTAGHLLSFALALRDVGGRLRVDFRRLRPVAAVGAAAWLAVAALFRLGAPGLPSAVLLAAAAAAAQALLLTPGEWRAVRELAGSTLGRSGHV